MPNLSQIKRQRMLDFLNKLREEHRDDDGVLIALGEIESELNAKKYGLHWGFVRDKDNRLYINNTEFAIDMADDHWKPISQVF